MSKVTPQEIVEALLDADTPKSVALARYIKQHGIAPPDGMVLVRKDLVEFLHGAEQFGGVWFGEKHPNHVGSYWWRKFLSAAPEAKP